MSFPRWEGGTRKRKKIPPKKLPSRIQKADSPAVLLVKSRTPHKSFLFLLEEKIGARKIKNVKKTFMRVARFPSDGGAGFLIRGFAQKMFELRSKMPSKLRKNTMPMRFAPRLPTLIFRNVILGGEGGIRTPDTETVCYFSRVVPSTTQPPLRN